MIMGFTKLSDTLVKSTIMKEDLLTFKVWIILLSTCSSQGISDVTTYFLSILCGVTETEIDESIFKLEAPDLRSKTKENEGRRLSGTDGCFVVLNYQKYRDFSYSENPDAKRQRKHREKESVTNCDMSQKPCDTLSSASVSEFVLVFDYWVSKENLIKHSKLSDLMKTYIEQRLSEYTLEDIKRCIDNYNLVLSDSDKYWYGYKSSIDEFFREGVKKPAPYLKFTPERFVESNFLKTTGGNKTKNKAESQFPEEYKPLPRLI